MGIINVLDKHTAELIAAGEVVERPASVIKELIENSIDAGAKNIVVEIKNGGTSFIRVNDDGCGIMKDDVKNAFLRHATSKVKTQTDLNSISTLGFRGEALASISAVSKLQLITRCKEDAAGTCYEINGGEEVSFSDAGCPVGTTFIIRDLFYNVPARMKFLKKDVSEGNAVSAVMDKAALSHPEVSFTYIKDGRQSLKTSGDGKLKSAVYSVYGRDFATGLIPVDYSLNGVRVWGYISKPNMARPNRNMQNFFINGRYVKTRTASAAVEEAFKGSIMVGKFPSCVLHFEVALDVIDVNVHPAKIEVRFINERPVFDAVYHAVKSALLNFDSKKGLVFSNPVKSPVTVINTRPFESRKYSVSDSVTSESILNKSVKSKDKSYNPFDELDFSETGQPNRAEGIQNKEEINNKVRIYNQEEINNKKVSPHTLNDEIDRMSAPEKKQIDEYLVFLDEATSADTESSQTGVNIALSSAETAEKTNTPTDAEQKNSDEIQPLIKIDEPVFRYIGEAFKTYIIVEKNNKELILIDKHAAHERIIYEKLKKEKGNPSLQMLLRPIAVTLSKEEYNAAVNNLDMFKQCSFEVEDFGNGVLLVRGAPVYLDESDIADSVTEMAQHIAENKKDILSDKMDWIYHNIACRAAIKAGNKSTEQELIEIAKIVDSDPNIRYCPHGRPTGIVISKYEIEKNFGRV